MAANQSQVCFMYLTFIVSSLAQNFACLRLWSLNLSCQPSTKRGQSFVSAERCWSNQSPRHHSFAFARIPPSFQDPLGIRQYSVVSAHGCTCDLLFSINLGMPNMRPMETTAIRIMGFLRKDNGETICVY